MKTDIRNMSDVKQKILRGLELVSIRLIAEKKKNNQDLVIMEGDVIKIVKASEL